MDSRNLMHTPIFDLRVTDQQLKEELTAALHQVLDHGRLFLGPEVEEFEEKIAKHIGMKYAVGVGSGSSALFMALRACGIKEGDEVVTTPLSWIISSNAIRACGAIPVFTDVREDFNIDPSDIEQKITVKTKAIVPVHYAGHMCDMDAISDLANKHGLIVVEDAAQAFGAELSGAKAGSFSLAAALSMNPMKVLGGYGEAGAVVTDDENIFKQLKILRYAGTISDPKKYITNDCREISLNHKMDTINAALLLVSLAHLPERIRIREGIAQRYDKELPSNIKTQKLLKGEIHGRYVYPILSGSRDLLKVYLEDHRVETKVMHEPLVCDAAVYRQYESDVPVARNVLKRSLIIPSHEKLSVGQVDYILSLMHTFSECETTE